MLRKVAKKIAKDRFVSGCCAENGQNFGDRVRSGLGIEEAIEREAGRAKRGQDGAQLDHVLFVWAKNRP